MPRCRPSMPHWRRSDEHPNYSRTALCLAGLALTSQASLGRAHAAARRLDELAGCCRRRCAGLVLLEQLGRSRGHRGRPAHSTTTAATSAAATTRRPTPCECMRALPAARSSACACCRQRCPVEAKTPIHDLGNVATDDSARWLIALSKRSADAAMSDDFGENVLAALAMHRGDVAQDALAAIARGDGSRRDSQEGGLLARPAARHRWRRRRDLRDVQRQGSGGAQARGLRDHAVQVAAR